MSKAMKLEILRIKGIMKTHKKTFKVTYDSKTGGGKTILVKANDPDQALIHAKNVCVTGKNFRDAIETNELYSKPSNQVRGIAY